MLPAFTKLAARWLLAVIYIQRSLEDLNNQQAFSHCNGAHTAIEFRRNAGGELNHTIGAP